MIKLKIRLFVILFNSNPSLREVISTHFAIIAGSISHSQQLNYITLDTIIRHLPDRNSFAVVIADTAVISNFAIAIIIRIH